MNGFLSMRNLEKELLNKDYEFKLGMESNSLLEFKDAIRDWSVLNGREIRIVKSSTTRVRVECRAKCGFVALCSKVGDIHTYQLKTWWVHIHVLGFYITSLPAQSGYPILWLKKGSQLRK